MKKRIIIISIILVLLIIGFILLTMNSKTSKKNIKNNINSNEKEVTYNNDDYNYDFSNYEVIDVNLDEIKDNYEITKTAVYHFTGKLKGYIKVESDENIKIILDNVEITNESGPAIYVSNAKNLYMELIGDNTLTDSSNYSFQEGINATIYSKDDLIIFGDGTLNINANYNDAIASSDDLIIKSGTYKINAKDDGIRGKDSVIILDGNFEINTNGDGIKTTNEKDSDKGNILIKNGTFNITSNKDAIDSINSIEITNGNFNITTDNITTNSSGFSNKNESSKKGIKAKNNIVIKDITLESNTKDDTIHSNKDITIEKGNFNITSSDDGIHADGMIEINDGVINITASEGIEATYIKINNGSININAKDDGINAGAKSNEYSVGIEINGGDIKINMGQGDTDAIDSNGNLYINGGTIDITSSSPFDYDREAKYTNGTIIVNGTTTNEITNQMMGGGMPHGNMQNGNPGGDFRRR